MIEQIIYYCLLLIYFDATIFVYLGQNLSSI